MSVQKKSKGVAVAAAVLLAHSLLAACSSPTTRVEEGSSAAAPSKSPVQPAVVQQAVAAYRAMWADMEGAATTSDASSPQLADHASGAALRLLQYMLSKDRQEGLVAKGSAILSPEVTSAKPSENPTRVDIQDCFDDTHWLLYKLDGSLKNNVPGGHYATTAKAQLTDGQWKIMELHLGNVGSC
jgi:hypothetical protein